MGKRMSALKKRRGQGLTEYIIIVAIVAVLSIAIVMKFGNQIRAVFWSSGSRLAGESAGSVDVENTMGAQDEETDLGISDL